MTKLDRVFDLENGEFTKDEIIKYFCPKSFGFKSPCLMSAGLKDCVKHWNENWNGEHQSDFQSIKNHFKEEGEVSTQ
jgi:hypothetical protein